MSLLEGDMFCKSCGYKVPDDRSGARFCPLCGAKLFSADENTDDIKEAVNDDTKTNAAEDDEEIYDDKDATVALDYSSKKNSDKAVNLEKNIAAANTEISKTLEENIVSSGSTLPSNSENREPVQNPIPPANKRNNTSLILKLGGILLLSILLGIGAFFVYNYNLPSNRYNRNCAASEKYWQNGEYEKAIEAAKKAIDIDPKKPQGYVYLAKAYYYDGDYEKAISVLTDVPKRIKDDKIIVDMLAKMEDDSLEDETISANDDSDSKVATKEKKKSKVSAYEDLEKKSVTRSIIANMKYISSDVSEYPVVKVYYQILDTSDAAVTLSSPTAAVKESIAGGAYIEREVKKVEKLEGNQGLSIDIVADKSGSMEQDMPKIKNVMSQFINSLDYNNGDQAEFLAFEDSVMYMCSYTRSLEFLNNGVASLSANGNTALYDACMEGVRNASAQAGAKCVIVFTDGQDNASYYNEQDVINAAIASSVPIYIIGAGDVDSYGLTYIAEQTKGRYWNINDLYDMSSILQNIYTEQKDLYCIEYVTDQSIDAYTERSAQCLVLDNTYTCENESTFVASKVIAHTKHDSKYELVKADVSWSQANAEAIQRGGHLVTITSEEEMQTVSKMAADAGLTYVWMGGYTMINNGYCYGHWITGENFEQYQVWYPGEPSRNDRDGTEEKYLILWNVAGIWSWNDERDDPIHDPALSYFLGKTGYVVEYEE